MALTSAPPASAASAAPRPSRHVVVLILVAALVVGGGGLIWWTTLGAAPGAPPSSLGVVQDRSIPASVLELPLVDQNGIAAPLASFAGHDLVVVPFLSSCQEECPLTTAALLAMRRDMAAVGLTSTVDFVEVSVDPGRDTPARLAAYARLTGTSWPLLTGSPATLQALWHYFGVYYQTVPEDSPAGIDWETGTPYTYDVNHSDGFILVNANGYERFATVGPFDLRGRTLPAGLAHMLSAQGRIDYQRPPSGSWTVAQALQAIGWMLGRSIPAGS